MKPARKHLLLFSMCIGLAVPLSACFSAPVPDAPMEEAADVRAAISRLWYDHIEAAKAKDLAGVIEMYAEDAVYLVPGVQDVRGRPAIEEMEAGSLAEADVLEATHTIRDLRVFGDVAYEIGTVSGPVRPRGQSAQTVTFPFMAMWQRQASGAWRVRGLVGKPEGVPPSGP